MTARILVVNDHRAKLTPLVRKLERDYYDVVVEDDPGRTIEAVLERAPDLVMLAAGREEDTAGFENCLTIRRTPSTVHVPILFVTNRADTETRLKALEAGADDVMVPPFRDDLFTGRVRALIRQKITIDEWRLREDTSQRLGILAAEDAMARGGGKARVLYVHDEDNDEAIRRVCGMAGYAFMATAFDPNGPVSDAAAEADVIFVNLTDPNNDPLRLVSQIRSVQTLRSIPILVGVEAEAFPKATRALDLGANDVLISPATEREIVARCRLMVWRKRYVERLRENYHRSVSLASTDALTGLYNRRYLETHFRAQVERAMETGKSLALLMVDIDNFKDINDQHGHFAGDVVLREVAARLSTNVRGFDFVARLGGEEFAVVMPHTTEQGALIVAERLRSTVSDLPVSVVLPDTETGALQSIEVPVTISIGIALTAQNDSPEELTLSADEALYAAKRAGRNCVYLVEGENQGALRARA